eukprot:Nk52_evm1s2655 gene=Nk52_evmTU1s2655
MFSIRVALMLSVASFLVVSSFASPLIPLTCPSNQYNATIPGAPDLALLIPGPGHELATAAIRTICFIVSRTLPSLNEKCAEMLETVYMATSCPVDKIYIESLNCKCIYKTPEYTYATFKKNLGFARNVCFAGDMKLCGRALQAIAKSVYCRMARSVPCEHIDHTAGLIVHEL